MDSSDSLFIVIEDSSKGELYSGTIDVDIKKLPELVISRIVWVNNNDPNAESKEISSADL